MEIPENLGKFVPEISKYDDEVVKALYEAAFNLHSSNDEWLLRYYYFGFLLTSDRVQNLATEIEISNTKIKKSAGKDGNPYWLKYNNLLTTLDSNDNENTVDVVVC